MANRRPIVLVLENDLAQARSDQGFFELNGYQCIAKTRIDDFLAELARTPHVAALVLDLALDDVRDGLDVLELIDRSHRRRTILLTAYVEIEHQRLSALRARHSEVYIVSKGQIDTNTQLLARVKAIIDGDQPRK